MVGSRFSRPRLRGRFPSCVPCVLILVGSILLVLQRQWLGLRCASLLAVPGLTDLNPQNSLPMPAPLIIRLPQPALPAPIQLPATQACSTRTIRGKAGLVLTYDNKYLQDGAGQQIQRTLGLYVLSVYFGIGYAHTPLRAMDNYGIVNIGTKKRDDKILNRWRSAFNLPEHHTLGCKGGVSPFADDGCDHVKMTNMYLDDLLNLMKFNCSRRTVVHIAFQRVLHQHPEFVMHPSLSWRRLFPWLDQRLQSLSATEVRVLIHVRRGDLFYVESGRMLPNEYYIAVASMVGRALRRLALPHVFEIHTESVLAPINVTVRTNRTSMKTVLLSPDDNKLWEFDALSPKRLVVNGDPLDALQAMASADVFIASCSAFSKTAAWMHEWDRPSLVIPYGTDCFSAMPTWFPLPTARPPFTWLELHEKALQTALAKRFVSSTGASLVSLTSFQVAPLYPRIIHRVELGASHDAESHLSNTDQHLLTINPSYVINRVTNALAIAFMNTHFPAHLKLFKALAWTRWKSDLLSYMLLYVHGGVYVEQNLKLVMGVDELFARFPNCTNVFVIGSTRSPPYAANNGFIVTPPRNPLFLDLIEYAARDGTSRDSNQFAKRMYAVISEHYPCIQEYARCRNAFFLKEVKCHYSDEDGFDIDAQSGSIVARSCRKRVPKTSKEKLKTK